MRLKEIMLGTSCVLKRTGERVTPLHPRGHDVLCETGRPTPKHFNGQSEVIMQYSYKDLKALIESVTREMDAVRPGMYNPRFTELALMLAAHESHGGLMRAQIGGGPARGLFGFEERTYLSTWQHSDTIAETSLAMGVHADFGQVEDGDRHSIFMCRHLIAMDTAPLPRTIARAAVYTKLYWNSPRGKATPQKYLTDYNLFKEGRL